MSSSLSLITYSKSTFSDRTSSSSRLSRSTSSESAEAQPPPCFPPSSRCAPPAPPPPPQSPKSSPGPLACRRKATRPSPAPSIPPPPPLSAAPPARLTNASISATMGSTSLLSLATLPRRNKMLISWWLMVSSSSSVIFCLLSYLQRAHTTRHKFRTRTQKRATSAARREGWEGGGSCSRVKLVLQSRDALVSLP